MTSAELKQTLENITTELSSAGDFVGILDPALLPFIVIGKAVAKQIPELAAAVDDWIQGNPPTQAEVDDLHAKLAVLGNPDLP